MTLRPRVVSVKQLPGQLNPQRGRLFFRDMESSMNVERPSIVLDCSNALEMDNQAIHLLLCCLEGALKRNGDVRLAAVTPKALASLEHAGADRLFRIFDTVNEAVDSFQRRAAHPAVHAAIPAKGSQGSANAA